MVRVPATNYPTPRTVSPTATIPVSETALGTTSTTSSINTLFFQMNNSAAMPKPASSGVSRINSGAILPSSTHVNTSSTFTPTKTLGNSSSLLNAEVRESTTQAFSGLRTAGSSRPFVYSAPLYSASLTGVKGNKTAGQAHPTHASGLVRASYMNSSFASGYAKTTGAVPGLITSLPKPTAFLSGTPIWPANATLPPQIDYGIMSLMNNGICRMGLSCATCSNFNAQSCSCANSVSKWFDENNRTTSTTRVCSSYYIGEIPGTTQPQTCSTVTLVQPIKSYKAPAECCDKCNIRANEVQVIFWPDTGALSITKGGKNFTITALPASERVIEESTLVSNGFTYVSPSVYISYKSLQAAISCVTTKTAASAWTNMGPAHTTIRAYAPEALSRAKCFAPMQDDMQLGIAFNDVFQPGIFNGWEKFRYQDILTPPPEEELVPRYQTCFPQITTKIPGFVASGMHAYPRLSIPKDVTDIDPLWKTWGRGTCTPVGLGAYDPPRTLTKKSTMVPVSPKTTAQVGASGPTPVPALPAAAPSDPAEVIETRTSAAVNPSTQFVSTGLEPSPTSDTPGNSDFIVTVSRPMVDPITTLDPNDPGLTWVGQRPKSSPIYPIYEAVTQRSDSDQAFSPSPAAIPQPEQGVGSQNNLQQLNSNPIQVPADQGGNEHADKTPIVDPNSIPITLTPINPTPAPQVSPNTPSSDVAHFIVQGFSGGQPQPPSTPDTQPPTNGKPAQNHGSGASGVGNVPAHIPAVSSNSGLSGVGNVPANLPAITPNHIGQGPDAIPNTPPSAPSPNLVLSNNQIVQSSNGGLQIGGQTLVPGSQVTVSEQIIDHPNPSTVIANGNTYNVVPVSGSNPLVVDNQSLQRGSSGALIVADSTIQPDQPATISGHTYSLAGSFNVVVDHNTYALPPTQNAYLIQRQTTPTKDTPLNTPVTLGNGIGVSPQIAPSSTSGIGPNQVFAFPNGETASVGGSPVIVSGSTYSMLPSNQGFLVNGASTLAIPAPSASKQLILTVGSQAITVDPSGLVIPSASIAPGGPAAMISGTPVSLDASSRLYVGSSVMTLGAVPQPSSFSVGSEMITPAPSGFAIAEATITPGGPATIISGTKVSLDTSSHLYVGSSTITLIGGAIQSALTIGSQIMTPAPTGVVIPFTSVSPGGPAVTVSGTLLSLDSSSHLQIGTSIITLSDVPSSSSSVLTVGTQTFAANPTGFNIGSETIAPGGPAKIVAGMTVSLDQDGQLVVGTSTLSLSPSSAQSVFTVGFQTFTANPTGFSVGSATMTPGGPASVIAGTPLSLGQNGLLLVGTSTLSLYPTATKSIFTIGAETFTANPTGFQIGRTTVIPGGPAEIVAGTTVSLGRDGLLVLGTSTLSLPPTVTPVVFTVGTQTFSVNPTGFQIASTSLIPGGLAVTVANTVVSLGQDGLLVIGSGTMTLSPPAGPVSTMADGVVATVASGASETSSESALAATAINAGTGVGPSPLATDGEDLMNNTSLPGGVSRDHGNAAMKGIIWDQKIMIAVWAVIIAFKAFQDSF